MNKHRFGIIAVALLMVAAGLAEAQQRGLLERLGIRRSSTELSEGTIADGLKEALRVGIDRTIELVGKTNGYLKNDKIKINPPKTVQRFERPLRVAGYGPQYDEFVLSMNRAAENAAPVAKDIFVDAITEMTIDDARRILKGKDTAATEYLDEHTRDRLTKAFLPHVKKSMDTYSVTQKYDAVVGRVSDLPLGGALGGALDEDAVEKYTVDKALDGMFYVLGEQEKRIREDPAARATDLLKKVFQ